MSDITETIRRRPPSRKLIIASASVVLAIALIAVVSALTGGSVGNGKVLPTSDLVGKHLKDFSLTGLSSGSERGPWQAHHASVIIFFASWCPPCKAEIPKLATYVRTHHDDGVLVLGMDAGDERPAAKAFVKKDDVTFPIAFDPNDDVTAGVFSIGQLPDTVFVNAKGIVTGVHLGAISTSAFSKGIAHLKSA